MGQTDRPTTVQDRVLEALRDNPEGLSFYALGKAVSCNPTHLRRVCERLQAEETIAIERVVGAHGPTNLHTLLSPEDRGQLTFDAS